MASSDVPWWGALILAILTAVVSVVATIYLKGGNRPKIGAPSNSFFTDTITYIPHILILFGVFADIFTLKGVYSIPSLIGILSMPASKLMSYVWSGLNTLVFDIIAMVTSWFSTKPVAAAMSAPLFTGTSTTGATKDMKAPAQTGLAGGAITNYIGCNVQGFEGVASPFAPQTLVVTATIFAYYMIDLLVNRSATEAAATIVAFLAVYGTQAAVITACQPGYWPPLTALAEGILFGGGAFGVVNASAPERLPSSVLGGGKGKKGGKGGKGGAGGAGGPGDSTQSSASNDPALQDLTSGLAAVAQACPAGSQSNTPTTSTTTS